jgi:CheY-like chemotaxis protein
MKIDGSFSISVVARLLKVLKEHDPGMNRTNLAGKAGLNYGTCVRYVDLLILLRWVSLSHVRGNLIYLTLAGRNFMELIERDSGGPMIDDDTSLVEFLKNPDGGEPQFQHVQTESVLDRHRNSDFASRIGIENNGRRRGSANIMIIEDELDVLLTYEVLLTQQGFNVYAFSDPRQALQEFAKNNYDFDLVISDIRMNSINGIQLYREFKAIAPDVKIIFVSALDAAPELISALPGFKKENFVAKPVDQAKLTKTIHSALVEKSSPQLDATMKRHAYN